MNAKLCSDCLGEDNPFRKISTGITDQQDNDSEAERISGITLISIHGNLLHCSCYIS